MEIMRIVGKTAEENNATRVQEIHLDVGALAGVMVHSLAFCMEVVVKDTIAAAAQVIINEIEGNGQCPNCGNIHPASSLMDECPDCPGFYLAVQAGRELRVSEIEVEN